jgi:hypothetical protein
MNARQAAIDAAFFTVGATRGISRTVTIGSAIAELWGKAHSAANLSRRAASSTEVSSVGSVTLSTVEVGESSRGNARRLGFTWEHSNLRGKRWSIQFGTPFAW